MLRRNYSRIDCLNQQTPQEMKDCMNPAINKSSISHPLQIDTVHPITGTGAIGMSLCPGKHVVGSMTGGNWFRDLETDIGAIQSWAATVVLTLLESWELADLRVENLGSVVADFGIVWYWIEVPDGRIPEGEKAVTWHHVKADLLARLNCDERIFIHCKGGLGRTGTLAAELLVSFGEEVSDAMKRVRIARPGAIETMEQEDYLEALR
jgi:ADP-ribosyl-[dinitrogen reductase] hydrolase